MRPSFAQFQSTLHAAVIGLALMLGGCATLPPPTAELDAARSALARAEGADADQYATQDIAQARSELAQAQAAMANSREAEARRFALAAAADADLAHARSRDAVANADLSQRSSEIAELRERLQMPAEDLPMRDQLPEAMTAPGTPVDAAVLSQRLASLDADPALQGLAAYERLRARQALDTLATGRSSQRAADLYLAERRVDIALVAARTEAIRRQADQLDRERSQLLVEASRQDAARARQEAERLRVQAQIQAEETQRLRAAAEVETMARQQAEEVIFDVASDQADKLASAREREAALARQEAALMAGGSLPASRRDARGEVFTLAGDAFGSGQATLTPSAAASVQTLAAYLQTGSGAKIRIEGHTDGQGEADANLALSQRRAAAVRDALAAAGLQSGRLTAVGRGEAEPVADNASAAGRTRNRRVEIIVLSGN